MKIKLEFNKQQLENEVKRRFARLNNKSIEVGYIDNPELEFIAQIQEHGAVIPVTQKMRFYLGMKYNIWLSPEKNNIVIPPRHFMYTAFEANKGDYGKRLMKFYSTSKNVNESVNLLAQSIVGDVQNSINQHFVKWEDNSDMTIFLKGFNRPLVNKGNLLEDVTYKVNYK